MPSAWATALLTAMSRDYGRPRPMIRGEVGGNQQALATIEIIDSEGRPRAVEAVLDTGFTGYLTLPAETIQ